MPNRNLTALGELLRRYREVQGLSQTELGQAVTPVVHRTLIAHLEQGLRLPEPRALLRLMTFLQVPDKVWSTLASGASGSLFSPGYLPASRVQPRYIAVAGLMGSGKTTLAKRLAQHLGYSYVAESAPGVQYLSDLAKDPSRWAFDTQLAFLCHKAIHILHARRGNQPIVVDRSISEDADVFARHFFETGQIDQRSYDTYNLLAGYFSQNIGPPDVVIYCNCSIDEAMERIRERNRDDVPLHKRQHVASISRRYRRWLTNYRDSTTLTIDAQAVDWRPASVSQAIAADLQAIFQEPRASSQQLDLFVRRRQRSTGYRSRFFRVVARVPFRYLSDSFKVPAGRLLPFPCAYIAAPFTARAISPPSARTTLFPIGQVEGEIRPGRYRSMLLGVEQELNGLGFATILPHRDVNKWGKINLTSDDVMRRCTEHVLRCDLFVGLLGRSHGSHYECGLATARGIPSLIVRCDQLEDSFLARGIETSSSVLVVACRKITEIPSAFRRPEVIQFLKRHLVS